MVCLLQHEKRDSLHADRVFPGVPGSQALVVHEGLSGVVGLLLRWEEGTLPSPYCS